MNAVSRYNELKQTQESKGYKKGWVYFRMKEEFGNEIASEFCNNSPKVVEKPVVKKTVEQTYVKNGDTVIHDGVKYKVKSISTSTEVVAGKATVSGRFQGEGTIKYLNKATVQTVDKVSPPVKTTESTPTPTVSKRNDYNRCECGRKLVYDADIIGHETSWVCPTCD